MSVIVTYLEMQSVAELRPKRCSDPAFQVREAKIRQWQVNRFLYEFVGSAWSWWEKLNWGEEQWRAYAEDEDLRTWIATYDGSPAGYFELRRDHEGGIEITYFGLAPAFIGRGLGGPLLTIALEAAWAEQPKRVWVHTCTRDHPRALANYQARGMKICQTKVAGNPPEPSVDREQTPS
ncbi:MAG: GNAT family N-acetyltransferase [Phycisphaerae bacterium]|nr:GNAT family N-acetyltransferase [Phycisphaerae bacterium]